MGIKKGEKREWDIFQNIPSDDRINKTVTIKISQNDYQQLKHIKKIHKLSFREILKTGIQTLENKKEVVDI